MTEIKTTEKTAALPFGMIDSKTFSEAKCPLRWLVDGILVQKQPAVIGGPAKCLKTNIAIDLAISIGSGLPFLGKFKVSGTHPVAVFSGESGKATIQETARRVCAAKSTSLDACQIFWSFRLPTLSSKRDMKQISAIVREKKIKVVIIDPLYRCLMQAGMGASASNLYEVGATLSAASRACLSAGATPILIHHATKSSSTKDTLGLSDLAFAGIGEFARQWLLVSRREPYQDGSGSHALIMSVGGSAGHSASWWVDIEEGVAKSGQDRNWRVGVSQARGPIGDDDDLLGRKKKAARKRAVVKTPW